MDGLADDQRQTTATLWAITTAPLFTGDDLAKLDPYGISLLTNPEVIAQDQQGLPARPVSQATDQQTWYVKNNNCAYTVALFNLSFSPATITAKWSDIGLRSTQTAAVHDMWSQTDLGSSTGSFSATLPADGSRLLKITPSGPVAPVDPTTGLAGKCLDVPSGTGLDLWDYTVTATSPGPT